MYDTIDNILVDGMRYQHENINRAGSLSQSAKDHGAKFLGVRKTDQKKCVAYIRHSHVYCAWL